MQTTGIYKLEIKHQLNSKPKIQEGICCPHLIRFLETKIKINSDLGSFKKKQQQINNLPLQKKIIHNHLTLSTSTFNTIDINLEPFSPQLIFLG